MREPLQRVDLAACPDPGCGELREALSARLDLEPDRILIGNGATELIHLLARSLLNAGDAAAVRLRLLREHRVCVRDCASFGLPAHVRIGVRRMRTAGGWPARCRR